MRKENAKAAILAALQDTLVTASFGRHTQLGTLLVPRGCDTVDASSYRHVRLFIQHEVAHHVSQ